MLPSDRDRRRRAGRPPAGQIKQALLATTTALVYAQGVKATGVKQIALEAGTTAQAIYTNFGSKANLVSAALEAWAEQWRVWLVQALAPADPQERLLVLFDVLEQWLVEHEFRGSMVINTALELMRPDPAWKVIDAHRTALLAMLAGYAGEAGLPHPAGVAQIWLVLMDGAITAAVQDSSVEPVRTARQVAARILGR